MIIYLDLMLPSGSSDPPENTAGNCIVFYSVLLRMGFTCAPAVTSKAVVSYTAFPPLPAYAGGIFLLHWPWSHLHRTLSGILPCEARTFLVCHLSARQPRSFVLLTYFHFVIPASLITYTGKQLPPTNSLTIELFGKCSLLTPKKYSKNFSRRFASWYSGSSGVILKRSGSANCFSTASS